MPNSSSVRIRLVCAVSLVAILSGCSTLPSSGPTGRQIERGANSSSSSIHFEVVNLDGAAIKDLADTPAADGAIAALARDGRVDAIGPGDELQISIYEVGMTLFGPAATFSGGGTGAGAPAGGDDIATAKSVGNVVVAADGTIRLPYVGRLSVEGGTPYDVQRMIEQALHGKSQSPQAMVSVVRSPRNSAYLFGDVIRAGRIPLSAARERLLDVIAAAGGAKSPTVDTVVRLSRGGQAADMRLSDIRVGGPSDLILLPGDRIELITQQRTFSAFGATRVSEVPFLAPRVSLAEALARLGGPTDAQADPSAVYLFRYDPVGLAEGKPPTIYRLNLMRPESYIIAQNIAMHDKDLIYVANSASGPVTKFISILNQLFAPVFTVRSLTTTK